VLARVNDTIFVKNRLSRADKLRIEKFIFESTNIFYWYLKEEMIEKIEPAGLVTA
jgi:hypothetical protein